VIRLCLDRVVIQLFGFVGEVQTGASLPTVTAPRSCDTRYPPYLAQLTSQTMSALMGADLGHLCALQHGDGHRELSCGHWRKRAIAGVQHKTIGVRDSSP